MKNATRLAFNAYTSHIAAINGVGDATKSFVVDPSIEQKIEDRVQEQSDFLGRINIVSVDQQKGQILGLGASGPIASRTNTNTTDRATRDITDMTDRGYECAQTNFDSHVTYQKLDMWAKFQDFQTRMRNHVIAQMARDRLMIGWNGTSRAATTDLGANPLLQDVNIGWLEKIRTGAPENVISGAKIGEAAGGDYKNIDAAVMDASANLLDPWYKNSTDVVCICGSDLLSDKYVALANDNSAPTERAALQSLMINKQVGAKVTIMVPFFPADAFLLTPLNNLSVYVQSGTRRRHIEENAKRDRIEDYQSVNEDYVIEDLGACALFEGILSSWV
jgi:P2 family phage major capsid protein